MKLNARMGVGTLVTRIKRKGLPESFCFIGVYVVESESDYVFEHINSFRTAPVNFTGSIEQRLAPAPVKLTGIKLRVIQARVPSVCL